MAGEEWPEVALSELYEFSSGLSKPRSEFGFGHGFLTFKDVLDNYFVPDQLSALVNSTDKEQAKCSVKRGDVFLTRTSETEPDLGMSCVAIKDYPKATFNGFTKRLRPKSAKVVPEYAAYYFRGPSFRQAVTSMSSLSTRASLNNDMLSRLSIVLPSPDEQQAIGRVLKALDDKIELNRRMNATLEGLARAVFRSWFADFDPVVAKAAGRRPVGITADTAALFPDTFEDSPLGPIPKGWKPGTLNSIAHLVSGGTPSKGTAGYWTGNIPWVSAKDMKQTLILDAEDHLSAEGVQNGTRTVAAECVLILVRGMTLHNDVPICFTAREVAFNQDVKGIVPKGELHRYFVFLLVLGLRDELLAGVDAASHGTGRINTETLRNLVCVHPPDAILANFTRVVQPLLHRMIEDERQSQTLATLRDALLPRLLSGELRLKDAERAVGDLT